MSGRGPVNEPNVSVFKEGHYSAEGIDQLRFL